jgi:glycosyltransferase involved in cell wall biosynthesis
MIGPCPPPLGGVSVFIKRYKQKMENAGHEVVVLDPCSLSKVRYCASLFLTAKGKYDLISINVASFYVLAIIFLVGLASKAQVIDHNWRQLERWNVLKVRLFSYMVNRSRELILVGSHLKAYYRGHGVSLPLNRVQVQNAFIHPPVEDEPKILETYSADVHKFVETRSPLLVANGSGITFYQGVDIYGLDMCVELVAALKKTNENIGLLFALADISDKEYFEDVNRRIDELGIRDNFHFMTGQKELWPLLKKADLMVRPTCTDGYCTSVAEARAFGCAVVASDVCQRARGSVIFANRRNDDLLLKCAEVLSAARQESRESVDEEQLVDVSTLDYRIFDCLISQPLNDETQFGYSN